jgi:hypothetical protein
LDSVLNGELEFNRIWLLRLPCISKWHFRIILTRQGILASASDSVVEFSRTSKLELNRVKVLPIAAIARVP